MIKVIASDSFASWVDDLKDRKTRVRILDRIDRLAGGNFGDRAPVGSGVFELRLHFGPGYRIYYVRQGDTVVVLLCGGDKASQTRDIRRAQKMAEEWKR
ncbi:MAG: type II toxin-antitoxin system RelE/ParE family toxin [Hyphomicrobiaceae bacterium]|nr:type II toxin-antitoxin system RelE/ParE family toxin [Hyphomicrobiaceae bacterium]